MKATKKATKEELVRLLHRLEWKSFEYGPGSGFMGSGGDGRAYPSCPICHGIKPRTGAEREFTDYAVGHRRNCSLKKALT